MGLNIKDQRAEEAAAALAELLGVSKTRAVRDALEHHLARLRVHGGVRDRPPPAKILYEEIWPRLGIGAEQPPLSKAEREEILGIGTEGV